MASSGWVLVDDADPRIQYSPGWQAFVNGSELDGTKHGAAAAGLTASFTFTGTQVSVVGSLGSVDVHGIPTTLYALDGVEAGFYTAPVIAPGLFQLNVTFFSSKSLAPGDHTLVVTNVNGTSPNVFWLDYIEYIPSAASTTTTTTTPSSSHSSSQSASSQSVSSQLLTTSSTPTAPASNQRGPSTPPITSTTAAPTITQTSPSNSNTSTVTPGTSHNHVGAIAGGIVGGVAALVLAIALLLLYLRRRRSRRKGVSPFNVNVNASDPSSARAGVTAIRPFGSWRSHGPDDETSLPQASSPPSQKQMMMHMASASMPTLSATQTLPPPPTTTVSASAEAFPTVHTGLPPTPGAHPPSTSAADSVPTERTRSSDPPSTPSSGAGGQAGGEVVQPQVTQSVDSGLRLAGEGEPVVLPPPYTRE